MLIVEYVMIVEVNVQSANVKLYWHNLHLFHCLRLMSILYFDDINWKGNKVQPSSKQGPHFYFFISCIFLTH